MGSGVSLVLNAPGPGGLKTWRFGNLASPTQERVGPLGKVEVAIGDISFFETLLSEDQDTIGRFRGPVALLGQDLLAQLPLRLSAKSQRLWMKQANPYDWRSAL